jgi:hypothetical protein
MAKDWKKMRELKSSLFSYGEVRGGLDGRTKTCQGGGGYESKRY